MKNYKGIIKYYVTFALIMFIFSFVWMARNEIFEGMCCLVTAIVAVLVSIVNWQLFKRQKKKDEIES